MKPHRPKLSIEEFEDRLLPSLFSFGSLESLAPFSPANRTPAHLQSVSTAEFKSNESSSNSATTSVDSNDAIANPNDSISGQSGTVGSAAVGSTSNPNDPNAAGGSEWYVIHSTMTGYQPIGSPSFNSNDGSGTIQPLSGDLVAGGSSLVEPSRISQFATTNPVFVGSFADGNLGFGDRSLAILLADGRVPPWFNRDSASIATGLSDASDNPIPPTAHADSLTSGEASPAAPPSVAPATAASPNSGDASTPAFLLAVIPIQQGTGQSVVAEQSSQADSHLLSEITIAAISLAGTQPINTYPALTLVSSYPTTSVDFQLPSVNVVRSSAKAKPASTAVVAAESVADAPTLAAAEVNAPSALPVPGSVAIDAEELDDRIARVFAAISSLGFELVEELERPDAYGWLAAAGLLSVGAGYAAMRNKKSLQVEQYANVRSASGVWEGAENDVRNRR